MPPEKVMQPDLRCYYHPEREASSQCDRCGDYLCAECVKEWDGQWLCAGCLKEASSPSLRWRGKLACILNLAAAVAFFPLWFIAGVSVYDRNLLAAVSYSLAPMVVFAAAGVLSKRARLTAERGADFLLGSVWGTSLAGLAGSAIVLIGVLVAGLDSLDTTEEMKFLLPMTLPMVLGGWLLMPAMVRWFRAVRMGVKPLWAVVVSFLSTIVGIGVFGIFFFAQLAAIVAALRR